MPVLQALRVKGLEFRHLKRIRNEVGWEDLNLQKANFRSLVKKSIHTGKNFEIIKGISELASKEYAIRLSLEAVEKELESCKVNGQLYKETGSYILKGVD